MRTNHRRTRTLPQTINAEEEIRRLERMAGLLDAKFRIPGTGLRFGWDAVAGLVPGVGDAVVAAPSAWLIYRAHALGAPKRTLARMGLNTGVDFFLGSVPVLGNIFDLFFKSNLRNMDLLRRHIEGLPSGKRP